ncbi:hypothetical protein D1AOALGA4SA_9477 [Olavius algarvensis Delta 1 endosymbiont]|nr:hypothetical protein D1AOALGA4SA_9477 [Olavius algarvensis Delta 1 endosymbiont]
MPATAFVRQLCSKDGVAAVHFKRGQSSRQNLRRKQAAKLKLLEEEHDGKGAPKTGEIPLEEPEIKISQIDEPNR